MRVERGQQRRPEGGAPVRVRQEDLEAVAEADHTDQRHDAALQPLEPGKIERKDGKDRDGRNHRRGKQRFGRRKPVRLHRRAGEQIQPQRRAKKLGEVGRHGRDLGGDPQPHGRRPTEVLAAALRQRHSRHNAQLGREVLDDDRHRVRPQQHPQQAVAELAAPHDVGGEVARVDIRDRRDKGRPEVAPDLVSAEAQAGRPARGCGVRGGELAGAGGRCRRRLEWLGCKAVVRGCWVRLRHCSSV